MKELGNWGRSISWLRGFVWDGNTLVLNISNITGSSIINTVGNNLGATIGKSNTVFSSCVVSVAVLVVGILGRSGVSISLDSISKVVGRGRDWLRLSIRSWLVGWGWSICWGWGISWGRCWGIGGFSVNKDWGWGSMDNRDNMGSWDNPNKGSVSMDRGMGMSMGVGPIS